MKTKISIIMPIFNAEKYLSQAIDSILNQNFEDFEIILVNDGSADKSGEICDEYKKKDARVKVIHKKNGGICSARNVGMSVAQGQFIMFMDNDDILESNTLKDNYNLLIKYDADWVKFGKKEILVQGNNILKEKKTNFVDSVYNNDELLGSLLALKRMDAMTFVWDSIFKREIIINNKLEFDTRFKQGNEDIDFCESYAEFSNKLIINSKCFYNHFTRIGISESSKYSEEKINSYIYLMNKCNSRYKRYNVDIDKNKADYIYIITKQIVANVCEKLNSAGKTLSNREKCDVLKRIKNSQEFQKYINIKGIKIGMLSKKIYMYYWLFLNNHVRFLLFLDKYSRKLIYMYRKNIK